MRLTLKLTLALTIILAFQFALYGYLVAQRLTGFFERDVKQDALQIGRALSVAVRQTWRTRGIDEARALVTAANSSYDDIQIRFVWLKGDHPASELPELRNETFDSISERSFLIRHVYPSEKSDFIYTYILVAHDGGDPSALELRQSYASENWFTIVSVLRVIAFLLIVVATTATVMLFLGVALIGRPIRRLRDKMRRIGQGDLSGHLEVRGTDEIAQLSRDINLMNDELVNSRKRLEEETAARIAAIEQLRHADRLTTIGTLASGVAHELGTPLTVVTGHANLIPDASANDEREKIKSAILEQLNKMAGIVQQLLSFSRRRSLEKKPCNLVEILSRVVKMLTPFSQKRNIGLTVEAYSGGAEVAGDETQLEQVFTNLIINAIQASERGGVHVKISSVSAIKPDERQSSKKPHYCIEVIDSGAGMTEEQMKQIFDPFYTTKAPGHGTGMGLSIAHGIIEEHLGWISVTSTIDKGSCFAVYLPLQDRSS